MEKGEAVAHNVIPCIYYFLLQCSEPVQYVLSESCSLSDKDKSSNSSSAEEKDKQTEYIEAKIKLDSQWITKYVLNSRNKQIQI